MSDVERMVTVVGEWRTTGPRDRRRVWHLAKGYRDTDWQEVHCGGGIAFPGAREKVAASRVCPDCLEARKEVPS